MSEQDELTMLREAHTNHRTQLNLLSQRVSRLEKAVGPDRHTIGVSPTLREQVEELRHSMWHDQEAKKAIDQLRRLADAIFEVFQEEKDK